MLTHSLFLCLSQADEDIADIGGEAPSSFFPGDASALTAFQTRARGLTGDIASRMAARAQEIAQMQAMEEDSSSEDQQPPAVRAFEDSSSEDDAAGGGASKAEDAKAKEKARLAKLERLKKLRNEL